MDVSATTYEPPPLPPVGNCLAQFPYILKRVYEFMGSGAGTDLFDQLGVPNESCLADLTTEFSFRSVTRLARAETTLSRRRSTLLTRSELCELDLLRGKEKVSVHEHEKGTNRGNSIHVIPSSRNQTVFVIILSSLVGQSRSPSSSSDNGIRIKIIPGSAWRSLSALYIYVYGSL